MKVKARFAPSPTGLLHIGNIRTAIIVWLFARKNDGEFMLRIDDTDQERSKDEYTEQLKLDLKWLGLDWDDYAHQRDRTDRYAELIQKLKDDGRLYPCYETAEELSLKRKSLLSRGLPPIYDRGALKLTEAEIKDFEAQGRKPHWRFKLNDGIIQWNDLVRGEVSFDAKDMSDPVLIRENGSPLYHLCSVIDDMDFNITHIIRGEDHVANTAAHLQMFEALGAELPHCAHTSMIAGTDGEKLAKRLGSLSMKTLREDSGIEPMAIVSLLSRLGTSDPMDAVMTLDEAVANFDFAKFSRNMPKFDEDELWRLNAKILRDTPFAEVKSRLEELGLENVDEGFWNAVRGNLTKLPDITEWWHVAKGPVTPVIEDRDYADLLADTLPEGNLTSESWQIWLQEIKSRTDRKGKQLFMPIRLALTGMEHGPELPNLLPLIGRERILERLKAAA
ncbi:MAG: glutamate--tRNA ligase [Pseudomonadota bacterium]